MNANGNGKVSFGEFTLDPSTRVVWHHEEPVELPLKAIELLCLLVERRGDVVTKDEIWKHVWNDAFIEETNLTHNVYLLRKAFREFGADGLIKTVPRRGYRFVGKLSATQSTNVVYERATITDTVIEEISYPDAGPQLGSPPSKKRSLVAVLSAAALVLIAFGFWYLNTAVTPRTKIETLAVLPFRTLNAAPNEEHLDSGIADLLVTRLSNIKGLTIRPTKSLVGIKMDDPVEAGRKLNVDAVLEGTIFRMGDQVRITARLVRVADSSVAWSGEFHKPQTDELAVQNELALHISDVLTANLGDDERAAILKTYTGSVDAYRLYAQGRFEWNKRSTGGMIEAQRLFRNAIEKDPNFALAYSGLADTLAMSSSWAYAQDAVAKAIEIDPNLAEAHATKGFIQMFGYWDWDSAERSFQRSIELNSGYPTAHHWYATLLAVKGKNEEAKVEMQRAIDIDPMSTNYLADMGQLYYFAGDYDTAKRYCGRALELNPEFIFGHLYLHYIYLKTGEHAAAVEEMIAADKINRSGIETAQKARELEVHAHDIRNAFRDNGLRGFLDKHYEGEPNDQQAFYLYAIKHALLREDEQAISYLERGSNARTFLTTFVKAEPIFENLRQNERYKNVLAKMNLAD